MNSKTIARVITCGISVLIVLSTLLTMSSLSVASAQKTDYIGLFDGDVQTNIENLFDTSVVHKLPDTVKDTDIISLIIRTDLPGIMEAYEKADTDLSIAEYAKTEEGLAVQRRIAKRNTELLATLDAAGLDYDLGYTYNTVLSGFEITIKAGDLDRADELLGKQATVIVGEVYLPAETKLVENTVDVYETGIFQ